MAVAPTNPTDQEDPVCAECFLIMLIEYVEILWSERASSVALFDQDCALGRPQLTASQRPDTIRALLLGYPHVSAAIGLLLLISGCLYIPPLASTSPELIGEIKVGSTTRQQALALLGEPKLLKKDNFFIYDLFSSKGAIIGLIGGPGGAGVFALPLDETKSRLLLEFDESGLVKRYQVERGQSTAGGGVSSELQPETKNDVWGIRRDVIGGSRAKRIFKGVEHGLFGEGEIKSFASVAFSPDGKVVAAGEAVEKRIRLWDVQTGEQRMILTGEGGSFRGVWGVTPIIFSPDGQMLAAAGGIIPTVWELPSGAQKLSFTGHGSLGFFTRRDVHGLAFSPDAKAIASGGADGSINVWEPASGKVLTAFEGPGWINSLAFSPDGKVLAVASESIIFRDLTSNAEVGRISTQSKAGAIAFSPDGQLLAVATTSHVEIWRLTLSDQTHQADYVQSGRPSGQLVTVFLLPYSTPPWFVRTGVVFSPTGDKVAAGASSAVVWDLSASRAMFRYVPSEDGRYWDNDTVNDISFSPDSLAVVLATKQGVLLFDLPSGHSAFDPPPLIGEGCTVTVVRASQLMGSVPTHYISLDDLNVAGLETGDYTKFSVQQGHHTIGVSWRIGGNILPGSRFFKDIDLECRSGEQYFFGIKTKLFAWRDVDKVELLQITNVGGDFELEGKTFVQPGERDKNKSKELK